MLYLLLQKLYKFNLDIPQPLLKLFKNYLYALTVRYDFTVFPLIAMAIARKPMS
jgi:hypothetical protein